MVSPVEHESRGMNGMPSYIKHEANVGLQTKTECPPQSSVSTVVMDKAKSGLSCLLASYGDVSSSEEEGELKDPPALDTPNG